MSDDVTLYLGDCLEIVPTLPKVDAVITDPPYGAGKAEWDREFPTEWYLYAKKIAVMICIITGSIGIKDSVALMGDDIIDIVAARNLNGITRSPIGFSNWIACAIGVSKPKKQQPNFFEFSVRGDMPNHPSPKPIEYMVKLIERITIPGDTILDPFMGSGTTGVACMRTGRRFIGIELNSQYFDIAKRRIEAEQSQLKLPLEVRKPEKAVTMEMELA